MVFSFVHFATNWCNQKDNVIQTSAFKLSRFIYNLLYFDYVVTIYLNVYSLEDILQIDSDEKLQYFLNVHGSYNTSCRSRWCS